MSLRCSAALCTSSRIRKLFSAKSRKGLAFTDSLLQLSWSDISAGRSASIPRMLCFLGNGSTPRAIDVQFFLVRSTKNTRRQERLTEQANAAPTSVLEMLKLHKINSLLPVEELEKETIRSLDWSCQQLPLPCCPFQRWICASRCFPQVLYGIRVLLQQQKYFWTHLVDTLDILSHTSKKRTYTQEVSTSSPQCTDPKMFVWSNRQLEPRQALG